MMQKVARILGEVNISDFQTRDELRDDSRLTQAGSSTPAVIHDSNIENVSPMNSAPSALLQKIRDSAESLRNLIDPDMNIHENRTEIHSGNEVCTPSRLELVGRNHMLEMEVQRLQIIVSTLQMERQSLKHAISARAANRRRPAVANQVLRQDCLRHQCDQAGRLQKELDILVRDKNRLENEVMDLRRERTFVANIVDQIRLDSQERVDSLNRIIEEKDKQLRMLKIIDARFKQTTECNSI